MTKIYDETEFCGECYKTLITNIKGIPTDEKIEEIINECRHKSCETLNNKGNRII